MFSDEFKAWTTPVIPPVDPYTPVSPDQKGQFAKVKERNPVYEMI
jgi:hypothetical protein